LPTVSGVGGDGTGLTVIARVFGRAVDRAVREHLQVSVFDEHFDFPGGARDVRQVGRGPAVPGGRAVRRGGGGGVDEGPVAERRRGAAARQHVQHQHADRRLHEAPPPIYASAVAAAAAAAVVVAMCARPFFHHVFMPFPDGTGTTRVRDRRDGRRCPPRSATAYRRGTTTGHAITATPTSPRFSREITIRGE